MIGKTIARWLNVESSHPALYFSDSQDCILVSLNDEVAGREEATLPWQDAGAPEFDIYGQQEESPLNLVPANKDFLHTTRDEMDEGITQFSGGSEEVDDTFRFRKFVEPARGRQ